MRRVLLLVPAAACLSCAAPTDDGASRPGRLQRITNPNVHVTLIREGVTENVNIKKGRTSFVNYAVASPKWRVVETRVDDGLYVRLRDLSLRILKDPPTLERVSPENTMSVSLLVMPDELLELGLVRSRCTFARHPGERSDADELHSIVTELLDRHRGR